MTGKIPGVYAMTEKPEVRDAGHHAVIDLVGGGERSPGQVLELHRAVGPLGDLGLPHLAHDGDVVRGREEGVEGEFPGSGSIRRSRRWSRRPRLWWSPAPRWSPSRAPPWWTRRSWWSPPLRRRPTSPIVSAKTSTNPRINAFLIARPPSSPPAGPRLLPVPTGLPIEHISTVSLYGPAVYLNQLNRWSPSHSPSELGDARAQLFVPARSVPLGRGHVDTRPCDPRMDSSHRPTSLPAPL